MSDGGIADLFPDPAEAAYVALLKCTACEATGHCYSDSEILDERQYWDCDECGEEAVKHDVVMQTAGGEAPSR